METPVPVPVPLPGPDDVNLQPPDAKEAALLARGMASAAASSGGLTDVQRVLIEAVFEAMTGFTVDVGNFEPMSPDAFARALRHRDERFRGRTVQLMVLFALVLRPLPVEVASQLAAHAGALGVDEEMITVARRFAEGSLGLAAIDFQRNGYTATWHPRDAKALHVSKELQTAWDLAVADPVLADRWAGLEDLPDGTLGRRVWELYQARGFAFPGLPGSAPPLLAQHDWVHVLADYGTTVESEVEVFTIIARANDDLHAFSLLAMVVSLFETGYLGSGAGLFESSPGHLSAGRGMAVRLADAMRRGARCTDIANNSDSIDFLRLDWFDLAPLPVDHVRTRFCLQDKSAAAIEAGSVGPWGPGGISPYQLNAGRELAAHQGRRYESFGASLADGTEPWEIARCDVRDAGRRGDDRS
jgi:hypothetical protein